MDSKNIKSSLQDALEKEMPSAQVDLLSAVQSRLVAGKKYSTQQGEKMNKNPLKRLAFSALTVIALISITLATPQGRAWAQDVFQFFKQVEVTTIPLSDEELEWFNGPTEYYDLPLVPVVIPTPSPEMTLLPGCETAEKTQSYSCKIAYAESQLGFDLMELEEKPQGMEFQSVSFDKINKYASIGYGPYGLSLRLTQWLGTAPQQYGPWDWVPAGEVEKIKVGSYEGEYVSGTFWLPVGRSELEWSNYGDTEQRLAWSDGTYWYLLETYIGPGMTGYLKREQLIDIASSLVNSPAIQNEQPNPDSLTSLSDAEEYSGLDLKAPTLLPLGFEFSYARYLSFNNEVHLRYDGEGYMVIYEWEGKSIDFKSLSTTYENYEIVKVNAKDAFYGFTKGSSPYLFLWWREGNLNYKLYYYWGTDGISGVLSKEKMIAIAESMDDINVFRSDLPKSYEYVSTYEHVLDIDIHEFPTTPVDWSFDYVGADAYRSCITLKYASISLQGSLFISECKTNPLDFSPYSEIPRRAIERVKIGKDKGQYIVGWFDYDENGAMTWQPDTAQSLFWKDGDLWIKLTVVGENATTIEKEELIRLAESLR